MRHSLLPKLSQIRSSSFSGSSYSKHSAQFGSQGRSLTQFWSSSCRDLSGSKGPPCQPLSALCLSSFLLQTPLAGLKSPWEWVAAAHAGFPLHGASPNYQSFRFWNALSRGTHCFPATGLGRQHLNDPFCDFSQPNMSLAPAESYKKFLSIGERVLLSFRPLFLHIH